MILLVFAKFKALIDALEFNDPFRQNVENLCRFFVILRTVVRRRPKVQNHIFADNLSTLKCKENYLSHNVQFIDIRFYFEENMFFWFHPNYVHFSSLKNEDKAELLQLKPPHTFICMRNFINKKVGNRKN